VTLSVLRRFVSRHHVLLGIWEAMGMGFQGIRAYKMRAFLTILGVVMGIMTVTGMSSIVAGLNASMARQIATLGSSTIYIRPFKPGTPVSDEDFRKARGVTLEEAERIAEQTAVRYIAPMAALGKGDTTAFDKVYGKKLKDCPLNPFQRSYAYVLEHGMDVVNADMQNFKHLEENIVAAAESHKYF